jgi:hypothetical protein
MRALVATAGAVSALLGAACYAPDLRDCTVSCASQSDCAGDQICGGDHLCAVSARASQCARDADTADADPLDAAARDAALGPDARAVDAEPADAAPSVILHLHADGMGEITTSTGASCDSEGSAHGDCMIAVPEDSPITLDAVGENGQVFQQWMGMACSGVDDRYPRAVHEAEGLTRRRDPPWRSPLARGPEVGSADLELLDAALAVVVRVEPRQEALGPPSAGRAASSAWYARANDRRVQHRTCRRQHTLNARPDFGLFAWHARCFSAGR